MSLIETWEAYRDALDVVVRKAGSSPDEVEAHFAELSARISPHADARADMLAASKFELVFSLLALGSPRWEDHMAELWDYEFEHPWSEYQKFFILGQHLANMDHDLKHKALERCQESLQRKFGEDIPEGVSRELSGLAEQVDG